MVLANVPLGLGRSYGAMNCQLDNPDSGCSQVERGGGPLNRPLCVYPPKTASVVRHFVWNLTDDWRE